MPPKNNKSFSDKVKGFLWFWPFFLMAAIILVLSSVFFIDDINIKLNKKMTCTVKSTRVFSDTYSIGNGNGSYNGVLVESKDCPELMFTEMPDGIVGTDGLQNKLKAGHRYTFVYSYIKLPMDTTKAYSFTEE